MKWTKRSWSDEREIPASSPSCRASTARRPVVQERKRAAHDRIPHPGQPPGLLGRQRVDVAAQHLHEEHLAHPLEHCLASGRLWFDSATTTRRNVVTTNRRRGSTRAPAARGECARRGLKGVA